MEVVGKLPYIALDVEGLWNSRAYSKEEVDSMIEEGIVYEATLRINGKSRSRKVYLIGSAIDFENNRKIFYLMKGRNSLEWTCCSRNPELIDKIEILDRKK